MKFKLTSSANMPIHFKSFLDILAERSLLDLSKKLGYDSACSPWRRGNVVWDPTLIVH